MARDQSNEQRQRHLDQRKVEVMRALLAEKNSRELTRRFGEAAVGSPEFAEAQRQVQARERAARRAREAREREAAGRMAEKRAADRAVMGGKATDRDASVRRGQAQQSTRERVIEAERQRRTGSAQVRSR